MKALFSRIKQEAAALSKNNDGVGIVEVILILVVNYSRLKKYILCF